MFHFAFSEWNIAAKVWEIDKEGVSISYQECWRPGLKELFTAMDMFQQ